jgi:hypothetical protein
MTNDESWIKPISLENLAEYQTEAKSQKDNRLPSSLGFGL